MAEMDLLGSFLDDCTQEGGRVRYKHLYAPYVAWCEEAGHLDTHLRAICSANDDVVRKYPLNRLVALFFGAFAK